MTAGAIGVVRPIIVDGRVAGLYVSQVSPKAQPSNPANNPSSAASGSPSAEKRKTRSRTRSSARLPNGFAKLKQKTKSQRRRNNKN